MAISTCQQESPVHNNDNQPAVRKGIPVTPVRKRKDRAVEQKSAKVSVSTDSSKKEAFAAQVVRVSGTTTSLRPNRNEAIRQAEIGDRLFGGGFIKTGDLGSASLPIRSVGTAVLHPHAELFIPEYLHCGALLIQGKISLTGLPKNTQRKDCLLHTPGVSIGVPSGAEGTISLSPRGDTWITATTGILYFIDLDDEPKELKEGFEVIVGRTGSPKPAQPTHPDAVVQRKKHLGWLRTSALRKREVTKFAHEGLTMAGGLALRLEKNVHRLLELKEMNRLLSKELHNIKPNNSEREEPLRKRLMEQAREMVALKMKSSLLAHRMLAWREFALAKIRDTNLHEQKIQRLNQKIEELARSLPDLFDRPMAQETPNSLETR